MVLCNTRWQRLSEKDDDSPNMFASLARALASKPAYNLRSARMEMDKNYSYYLLT
jgi:hypothetical protein